MTPVDRRRAVRAGIGLWLLLGLAAGSLPPPLAAAESGYRGLPLADALERLRGEGLRVVYSSLVVTPDLTVEEEPKSERPREILDELLRPHRLAAVETEAGVLTVVRAAADETEQGQRRQASHLPVTMDEIVVTPSRFGLFEQRGASVSHWTREEVSRLPHLSDDLFRAISRLPGLASGDFSANFHIRGGERDEVLVLFDGLRVYEPFHLKDFQGVFSIFDTHAISATEVMTGGFPAEYGDRMSGVIEISSSVPTGSRTVVGVSFEKAFALTEGELTSGAGHWLAVARRGYLDILLRLVDEDAEEEFDPTYYDVFGKLQRQVGESLLLSLNALGAYDTLGFDDDGAELVDSRYGNAYGWLRLDGLTGRLSHSSVLSLGRVDSERVGSSAANLSDPIGGDRLDRTVVDDDRSFTVAELRQVSSWDGGDRHWIKFGGEIRRQEARYDYRFTNTITDPSFPTPPQQRQVDLAPDGWGYAAFVGDRFRLGSRLTLELGLRWDRQTHVGGGQTSPRLNLVTEVGGSTLRASWGRYHQSQGLHELQVADGVTDFFPAHRSEQMVLGLDHPLSARTRVGVQLYSKRLTGLRPRYENLFEPIDLFPEGQSDRVLLVADEGRAHGAELLVETRRGRFDGWLTYGWAEAEDQIGGHWQPRAWDQRHTVSYALNYRPGERWNVSLAGIHHSGWPTTEAMLGAVEPGAGGALSVPPIVFGPRNAERFDGYHRLDLRASRQTELAGGSRLTLFVEITNLLDRDNPRAIGDFDVLPAAAGGFRLERELEYWLPRLPSFGVSWTR